MHSDRGSTISDGSKERTSALSTENADGQVDRLRPLAAELVALGVDVIVTVDTPPTQAAKQTTSTIPIVIAVSADPVGAGLVKSLGHPGGNATGLSLLAPETDQKTLEVLKDTLPKTKRVAMIFDPKNQGMMLRLKAIEIAATKLGTELQSIPALNSSELATALALVAKNPPDALFVLSPIYAAYQNEIGEFARTNESAATCRYQRPCRRTWCPLVIRGRYLGFTSESRSLRGQDIEGCEARRFAGRAASKV